MIKKINDIELIRQVIDLFGTQNDLANNLGVHKQNISAWYTGKLSVPFKYLVRLEKVYDIKLEDLKQGKQLAKQLIDNETKRMRENG
jgi:plasmid maintenance system antidote protein VapI